MQWRCVGHRSMRQEKKEGRVQMRTCKKEAGEFCSSPSRSRQQFLTFRRRSLKAFVCTRMGLDWGGGERTWNWNVLLNTFPPVFFSDFTAAWFSSHAEIRVDADCNETEKHVRLSVTTHRDWEGWRTAGTGLRHRLSSPTHME